MNQGPSTLGLGLSRGCLFGELLFFAPKLVDLVPKPQHILEKVERSPRIAEPVELEPSQALSTDRDVFNA